MNRQLSHEILRQAPFGYAYHRLLRDSAGEPIDYIFLDVNAAFESMTGLCASAIIGKRATEVLPGLRSSGFDWVKYYGQLVLTGGREELTQRSEVLGRVYRVTAFSPESEHFVTLFQELTEETKRIEELQRQKDQIFQLSRELELVFNGTHDAMFLVKLDDDGEFRCMRVNDSYVQLVGFSREQTVGYTPAETMGSEVEKVVASYQRCVQAKQAITFEETLSLPTGNRHWLTTLTPVLEDEQVKYLIGSRLDITERTQAEAERARVSQRLHNMFATHTAVMLMIEPTSGRIVDANPAACQFYGYSRDELLQLKIDDINMLPKAEIERRLAEAAQAGQRYFLFPHRLKNGEVRLVDVYSCAVPDDGQELLFSIIFDVTEREAYRNSIQREKELARTTLYSIGDGVITTDAVGHIVSINKAAEDISEWKQAEVAGKLFADVFRLIDEESGLPVASPVQKVLLTGGIVTLANHTALVSKSGKQISLADSAAPIMDELGQMLGVVMVFRDVTTEKAQLDRIRYLSYFDQLTNLHNRHFAEEQFRRLDVPDQQSLAVIMGDLNGLKLTNDVFGHEAGDRLLSAAAAVLSESCPPDGTAIRWGGDEFVLLLPNADEEQAKSTIRKIKDLCSTYQEQGIQLSISLGYAMKSGSDEDIRDLLKEAEEQMYRQKLLEGTSFRNSIIKTLQATLAIKSYETEEHALRLREYSLNIGRLLNLPEKRLDELALLAMLHDIGKVGVKESVLQKTDSLTDSEWAEIRRHPEIGYRISQNTPELATVSEYILAHHERWDGKGYPRGLSGKTIPLPARILAVGDAYDAMVSERTYRSTPGHEQALAELRRHAGTQFDPEVVEAFLKVQPKPRTGLG